MQVDNRRAIWCTVVIWQFNIDLFLGMHYAYSQVSCFQRGPPFGFFFFISLFSIAKEAQDDKKCRWITEGQYVALLSFSSLTLDYFWVCITCTHRCLVFEGPPPLRFIIYITDFFSLIKKDRTGTNTAAG